MIFSMMFSMIFSDVLVYDVFEQYKILTSECAARTIDIFI